MFFKKAVSWIAKQIGGRRLQSKVSNWFDKTGLGRALSIAGDALLVGGAVKGVGALKGLMTGAKVAKAGQAAQQTQAIIAAGPKPAQALITGSAKVAPRAISQAAATASPSALGMGAAQTVGQTAAQAAATPLRALTAPPAISTMAPRAAAMVSPTAVAAPIAQTAVQAPSTLGQMFGKGVAGAGDLARQGVRAGMEGLGTAAKFAKENAAIIAPAAVGVSNVIGARMQQSLEEERMRQEQEARNSLAGLLMGAFGSQLGGTGTTPGQAPRSVTARYAPDALESLGRSFNALPGLPTYRG